MKEERKIVSEERLSTEIGGKIVGGVRRILGGPKGTLHQEVVYLGRSLGDPTLYSPGEQARMLEEAKRLLSELAGQSRS